MLVISVFKFLLFLLLGYLSAISIGKKRTIFGGVILSVIFFLIGLWVSQLPLDAPQPLTESVTIGFVESSMFFLSILAGSFVGSYLHGKSKK